MGAKEAAEIFTATVEAVKAGIIYRDEARRIIASTGWLNVFNNDEK